MRAFLNVSVLLTVAVAWAASATPEAQERAGPAALDLPDEVLVQFETQDIAAERPIEVEVAAGDKWAPVEVEALAAETVWIPLELRTVDGESGAPAETDLATAIAESRPSDGQPAWRSPTHVRRGDHITVEAVIDAAAGHVPDDGGAYRGRAYVSRRAERMRLLAPLRREADVVLRVIDAAGRRAAGAKLRSVTLSGGEPRLSRDGPFEEVLAEELGNVGPGPTVACTSEPVDSRGGMRIRGIPQLLDERFWVAVGIEDHENYTELRLGSLGVAHARDIQLPEERTWVWPAASSFGGRGCGGSRSLRAHCGRYLPARLEVVVFRRDGAPAAGISVALGSGRGTTDEYGRVVFEGLRPGTYDLDARDPDFVWSKASVELRNGESRIVELLEPPGWTAWATLLDSMGRPVPFARVDVSSRASVEYVHVEDGVQDLACYTDANGEIELRRMHHAPVQLKFRYGSRTESATLEEGEPYATVRLPPP